jgi:hypothetical protein
MREKWLSARVDMGSLLKKYSAENPDSMTWMIVVDPIPEVWAHFDVPRSDDRRISLTIGEFRDARAAPYSGTLLGRRWSGRLMEDAEIHSRRPVNELVRACVAKQLKDSGFEIVEGGGELSLTGSIEEFKAERQEVQLEVTVEARLAADQATAIRHYHYTFKNFAKSFTTAVEREQASGQLERFLRKSLEDLQEQVASDAVLMRFLSARN